MRNFQVVAALALGLVMGVASAPHPQEDSIGFGSGGFGLPEDGQQLGEPTRVVIVHPDDNGFDVTRTVIIGPTKDPEPHHPKPTKTRWTTTKYTIKPTKTKSTPTPTPTEDCEETTTTAPTTTKRPKPTTTYTEDDGPVVTRTIVMPPRF